MTISSQNRQAGPFVGNDTATAFSFAFKVFSASDLQVVRTNSAGVESTLVLDTDYTVTLNSNQDSNPGGTVTLPAVLATGTKLTITSNIAPLQATDLTNQGGFYPKVITNAFDKLTILVQQITNGLGRSIKFPISSGASNTTIPDAVTRASKVLGFDANGEPTVFSPASAVTDSGSITFSTSSTYSTGTVGKWLKDLYSSAGASLIGWVQSGAGAFVRWIQDKLRERVSVLDFIPPNLHAGIADGTNATDLSAYIQAALNAAVNPDGTGRTLFFPTGKYLAGGLQMAKTGQRIEGESKYGTWLIAKTGAASIIDVGTLATACRQTAIEKFSMDYSGLTSNADNAAIRYKNSYGNVLRDVHCEATNDNTTAAYAIYYGQGCYTTSTENVDAPRVRIYSPTADRPTTLTFINLDFGFMDIDNAAAITLLQPIGQSFVSHSFGTYRIKVVNCISFVCIGGDFEDDDASHYIYYFDNVTERCVSIGNMTAAAFSGGYAAYGPTGIPASCKAFLQDDKTKGFDYREGTWTPTLAWSTPGDSTIVPASATGRYVKNGNLVTCSFNFDNATFTNGTASGYLILGGLPFVPKTYPTDMQGGSPTLQIGFPTSLQSILVSYADPVAYLKKSDGSGGSVVVADVSGSGKYLRGTFTYQCAN